MKEEKQNVLLLVADQLRYDCIGEAGKVPVQTPNIDALAADGVFFENAYTSIPTCCPARQSFYACKRSESFGSYWNYDITYPVGSLPVEEYSFLRDFEQAGYDTVQIGRSELNPEHDSTEYGYRRHLDTWSEYRKRFGCRKLPVKSGRENWEGWVEEGALSETPTGFTAETAIRELTSLCKSPEKPFFMTVCFTSPHPPYSPHRQFYEQYDHAEKWASFEDSFYAKPYVQRQQVRNWHNEAREWTQWEPIVRKYYAQITELDYQIGRILQVLKDQNVYRNTTVIVTADHGDMCGSHKMFDKHYVLYEDVTHVPLIVKTEAPLRGHTKAYTVHNLDLGPTLMELSGIRPSAAGKLHGKSFAGVLFGGDSVRREAVSTLNGAQFGLYTQRCIKTDRWKYVWNTTDTDELYDLQEDPNELVNQIGNAALKDVRKNLRNRLLEILIQEEDPFCTISRGWAPRRHLEENRKD